MEPTRFVCAGYFLTRPVLRDDRFMATDLVPASLISLSGCLADFAFEFWWNDENVTDASAFGVPEDRFAELVRWYRAQFDTRLGAPNVAFSLDVIEEFLDRFAGDPSRFVVLGAGLWPEHAALLQEQHRVSVGSGEYGVMEMLDRHQPLQTGGRPLGFEPASYEYGLEHSWLCNSLESAVHAELGIAPSQETGLLESFEDGLRAVEYIGRDDVGAEPGVWLPWLVVAYDGVTG